MENIFNIIGIKSIWAYLICAFTAALTPTANFVLVTCLACMFNLWCGMRADGVTNIRCKNFSWKKFRYALAELAIFLLVMELISLLVHLMGDASASIYMCKIIAYCISYCYIDNGLKNICKAYPTSKGLWMVYLIVHLDFKRILKIEELINRYEEHLKLQNDRTYSVV